jgi:hypothetical protein
MSGPPSEMNIMRNLHKRKAARRGELYGYGAGPVMLLKTSMQS